MNIIKELLSEVLEVEIIDFNIIGNKLNYIIPNYETEEDGDLIYIDLGQNINIYEFAFKCKEWALIKGYIIDSLIRGYCSGKAICFVYVDDWQSEFSENCLKSFTEDTEIEAIIKACEWILENKSD